MKTDIFCGCCGNQTVIHNYQYSHLEFAKRKIFVKGSRSSIACQECGESNDMIVFGSAHIIPYHLKYITSKSIIQNNEIYENRNNKRPIIP